MTSPFSDELISAYVDGELTAQEQAYVEEQLRGNTDLRRMCDELRALRATLRAMPALEPPENFAERILRQAERRMLLDDVSMTDSSFVADVQAPSPVARRHSVLRDRALRDWRVGVAIVTVLAACVLAMLWLPPRAQQTRNVALAPDTATAAPAPVEQLVEEHVVDLDSSRSVRDTVELAPVTTDFALQVGPSAPRSEPELARRSAALRLAAPAAAQPAPAAPPPQNAASRGVSPEGYGGGGMMGGGQAGSSAGGFPGGSAGGMAGGGPAGASGSVAPKGLADAATEALSEPMTAAAPILAEPMISAPTGPGMGLTTEERIGPSDAGSAMGRLERYGDEANVGARVTGPLIDRLVSQLDATPMLLVKVRLPQHVLAASMAELGKSIRVDQLTDVGAVKALDQYMFQAPDEDANSRALAEKDKSAAGPVALEFDNRSGGPSQNVFVVHGSADQIRQSLAQLVATPDVAVETAPIEFKTRLFRSLGPSLGLKEQPADSLDAERQSGSDVASTAVEGDKALADLPNLESMPKRSKQLTEPAGVRSDAALAEPATDSKRSDMADERSQSSAESEAAPADRAGGKTVVSSTRERKDVAENRTIIYILFRLPKE